MGSAEADNNLRLIKEAFERWNSGDRAVELETIDPEVELYTPLSSTRGAPYRGHDGFRQWIADIDDQFETWEIRVKDWSCWTTSGSLARVRSMHGGGEAG